MNKFTLTLAGLLTFTLSQSYSQISNLEVLEPSVTKDYLKNYKAPDFKQRRLIVGFSGNGANNPNTIGAYRFSSSTQLNYSQYSNSKRYQGNLSVDLRNDLSFVGESGNSNFSAALDLELATQNRFYLNEKIFIGLHNNTVSGDNITSSLTFGYGRLEPVHYARNAMDIQRSLTKGNRLAGTYTVRQLTTIADRLAEINNVRFFDFRLRRIEQFEALDETLRSLGGISEFDMKYFVHLSDAYLYAQNFTRLSGFRNELGVRNTINNFSLSAFYDLVYDLPASYAVQHTFRTGVSVGKFNIIDAAFSPSYNASDLRASYQLGLFPNTRTNFNFGLTAFGDVVKEFIGAFATASAIVYLSPQFRLNFESNFTIVGSSEVTQSTLRNLNGQVRLRYAIF